VPQHGQLAMQYVTTPSVDVAFSTAYPARLPHDRSKLQQLDVIEEMLQGTLAGQWRETMQPPCLQCLLSSFCYNFL
jgi:hypothetical protein